MKYIYKALMPLQQMLAATAIFALLLSSIYGAPFAYATSPGGGGEIDGPSQETEDTGGGTQGAGNEANEEPSLQEVTICHATRSHNKPYETPNPADGAKVINGHDGHNGPVWFIGIEVAWGDIIPPLHLV